MSIYAAMSAFVTGYSDYDTESKKQDFAFLCARRENVLCTKFDIFWTNDIRGNQVKVICVAFGEKNGDSSVQSTFKMEV